MHLNNKTTNNPIKKMGKRPEQTFLQRRYTDGQQAHEKMFKIINYQGNANQNYDISPDAHQNGYN